MRTKTIIAVGALAAVATVFTFVGIQDSALRFTATPVLGAVLSVLLGLTYSA